MMAIIARPYSLSIPNLIKMKVQNFQDIGYCIIGAWSRFWRLTKCFLSCCHDLSNNTLFYLSKGVNIMYTLGARRTAMAPWHWLVSKTQGDRDSNVRRLNTHMSRSCNWWQMCPWRRESLRIFIFLLSKLSSELSNLLDCWNLQRWYIKSCSNSIWEKQIKLSCANFQSFV